MPPVNTIGVSYEKHIDALTDAFYDAYRAGSRLDKNHVNVLTSIDADSMQKYCKSKKLPVSLNQKPTTLKKWFLYHRDRPLLVEAKRNAREKYIETDAEIAAPSDLFEFANTQALARIDQLELANTQSLARIDQLEQIVNLLTQALAER